MKHFAAALIAASLLATVVKPTYAADLFPIKIGQERRIFEDATGKPFLLQGDTAWSLIAELKREDVETYLQDRRKRGFNTILVSLVEHYFSSHPPANAYGEKPFKGDAFGELNPKYFDHAAWVIGRAEELGFVVFLAPAYLGVNGGNQGWFSKAQAAGPEKMRVYGQTIARRFAEFHNIVWVLGGDFDAPDRRLVSDLAEGIALVAPGALQTVHSGRKTNTAELWADQPWLSFDTVYTYDDVHAAISARRKAAKMPVILLESGYEFERETTARTIRRNAYGALLAGAAGQFFGNNPIWHFTGPGISTADRTWQEALDSPGARSMTALKRLFDKLPWPQLQPDSEGAILAGAENYAASLPDGTLSVIYGDAGGFAVQKAVVKQGWKAVWYDPVSGTFADAGQPKVDGSIASYMPKQAQNDGGGADWLLLIGSAARLQDIQKR
ncbi:DUF4038 domain-containing protein [Ochrobactrum vermis]|uniref:DUF4038 domain-containing protein n=1 Tax=Ochrobactrum vermis TaxID=1827297 RepID=A0ABU8PIX8_9HYPH|nr:DUF4038 domain-containing protein [Ochrobactrum vermis]PQZ26491.1 hypothetical protein CQZ93_21435 [Ochrobactrum vermis]